MRATAFVSCAEPVQTVAPCSVSNNFAVMKSLISALTPTWEVAQSMGAAHYHSHWPPLDFQFYPNRDLLGYQMALMFVANVVSERYGTDPEIIQAVWHKVFGIYNVNKSDLREPSKDALDSMATSCLFSFQYQRARGVFARVIRYYLSCFA